MRKLGDEHWMKRCLLLAKKGEGKVSPNPLVGAVIIKNNVKIGEGFHQKYGLAHAETNAIHNALRNHKKLKGSTIYINLEPCFHYGHTPPCVDAIIKNGFKRVVIAIQDPNPLVSGKSIMKLRKNNIKCDVGVLRSEAEYVNEKFIKYISSKKPYIALKIAQTADGFIAKNSYSKYWITNKESRIFVHKLRAGYDAIVVGSNTVKIDDPELTVRHVQGRNPLRVIVDGNLSVPIRRKIFNKKANTIVFASKALIARNKKKVNRLNQKNVVVLGLPDKNGKLKIADVVKYLQRRKISSIFVEGGSQIYSEFLREKLVDKIFLFTAKKKFRYGLKALRNGYEDQEFFPKYTTKFGCDILTELYKQKYT